MIAATFRTRAPLAGFLIFAALLLLGGSTVLLLLGMPVALAFFATKVGTDITGALSSASALCPSTKLWRMNPSFEVFSRSRRTR